MLARIFNISRPNAPTLSLHEWGSGEPTFLLIHGFGDGGFIWNEFSPLLAALGRVIAVDLRGHGDSGWDADAQYNSAAHFEDINFVVDSLRLNSIVLVGHSLGGELALRLAARYPNRVRGLVVVDYGPELNQAGTRHIRKEFVMESRVYAKQDEYAAHLEIKLPLVSEQRRWALVKSALRPRANGGYELKRDSAMGETDPVNATALPSLWPILKDILCPTLIVRGIGSSVLSLSVAERMVGILPDGCLASVKLAGHAVMIDNPEGFAEATLSFIRRIALNPMPEAVGIK